VSRGVQGSRVLQEYGRASVVVKAFMHGNCFFATQHDPNPKKHRNNMLLLASPVPAPHAVWHSPHM
jgi:hypothetical protein